VTIPLSREAHHGSFPPILNDSNVPPLGEQSADLRTYSKAKQVVAREIRSLSNFFHKHGGEQGADKCRELMVNLAEDRFTLAVVGQSKRGKSPLMNAIIGQEILPTGILPVTSAVTILKLGPRERLLIPRPMNLEGLE
jgi:hypothetical protein